jgi:hypothetical protein
VCFPGANPTTSEFTTTTPALYVTGFLTLCRRKHFCFLNALGSGLPDGTYIFEPKIPFLVNFGGSYNGRCWYVLRQFGIFYGQLLSFMAIWCIFGSSGIFFPVLVCSTMKNQATLTRMIVAVSIFTALSLYVIQDRFKRVFGLDVGYL